MSDPPENFTDEELENICPVNYALMALELLEGRDLQIFIGLIESQEHEFQRLVRMHSRYAEIVAQAQTEGVIDDPPVKTQ